jgi:glyoxylase-like metal-dependent hydrolase (beta-lactamase superfamily II)
VNPTATETRRWTIGAVTVTSVVEDQTDHIPPEFFFPESTAQDVARHPWVFPDYADSDGNISLRVQAFVVEHAGRAMVVDPCVGNLKPRPLPFWNEQTWPFMERFADAGFAPDDVDLVVHTHLHADHVGWDTRLVDGEWMPTFTRARHLYTQRELDFCRRNDDPGIAGVYADSVAPVVDAGLADVVAEDADLGGGLRLESSTGHTPGHVSLWIESAGEVALVTGDFLHHPVQLAEPHWAEIGDADPDEARATRRRMLGRAAGCGALVLGTHFGTNPAGRVVVDGDVWRWQPEL